MAEKPMMACGHTANAVNGEGKPSCAICLTTEQAEKPSLEDRKAKCSGHKGGQPAAVPSRWDLPFFQHNPDAEFDAYYCGCWGWD